MAVAVPFYLAYVVDDTVAFNPAVHNVMNEYVFKWRRILSQTDKPALELEMLNPHIGILNASRKQWAWLSWLNPSNSHVEPLFLGRIVGNPNNVLSEIITVQFVSWPTDFFKQRQTLAETLKDAPFWDKVFVSVDKADDPDTILEARSELWCVDPITLKVTAEDIINASNGNIVITADQHFYDALDMHDGDAPLTAVLIDATVSWTQTGRGYVNMGTNTVVCYDGDGFINEWPKPLTSLGSGWTVDDALAVDVNRVASMIVGTYNYSWNNTEQEHADGDSLSINLTITAPSGGLVNGGLPTLIPNSPGTMLTSNLTAIQQTGFQDPFATDSDGDPQPINIPMSVKITNVFLPPWTIQTSMILRYDLARQRTERVRIMLTADLQAVINDPLVTQNSETITMTGRDVGVPIVDLLDWTTISGTSVSVGQIIFPDDPTLPGGKSAQICVTAGTAGIIEPTFSDIPGAITIDGTVHWSSMGTQNPTEGAQDWSAVTSYGPGAIILPRFPLYSSYRDATLAGQIQFPPIGTAMPLGRIVQGSNGYFFVCTLDGMTAVPTFTVPSFPLTVTIPPITGSLLPTLPPAPTEPTWDTTYGSTTADGSVTWTCIGNVLPDGKTYYLTPGGGTSGAIYVTPQFGTNTALHAQVTDNTVTWVSIGSGDIPAGGTPGNVWARSYFPSTRGQQSLEYLMMIGRAHIRKRARAVEIEFECDFETGVGITCRNTVTLQDTRIPGGVAVGKVTRAELSANGDTGEVKCHVTLGCAVGKGNSVTAVPGTPVYAAPGYMQSGYQKVVGAVVTPLPDIGYTPLVDAPNDDGLVLPLDKGQVVIAEGIKGDITAQTDAIKSAFTSMAAAARLGLITVNSINTSIFQQNEQALLNSNSVPLALQRNPIYYEAQLKPVTNGPFWDSYIVTTQPMTVEQGIDLTAASSP